MMVTGWIVAFLNSTCTDYRVIVPGTETLTACEDSHLLAVRTYWKLLQQDSLPPSLLNIAVWVCRV